MFLKAKPRQDPCLDDFFQLKNILELILTVFTHYIFKETNCNSPLVSPASYSNFFTFILAFYAILAVGYLHLTLPRE